MEVHANTTLVFHFPDKSHLDFLQASTEIIYKQIFVDQIMTFNDLTDS